MAKSLQPTGELKQLEDTRKSVAAHIEARAGRGQEASAEHAAQLAEVDARISELTTGKKAQTA